MKNELVLRIFATIQGLEKCISTSRKVLVQNNKFSPEIEGAVLQQERVVRQMRRAANKLQLQLVNEDWVNIVRSLDIIYGLNSMVRPEVLSTFSALAHGHTRRANVDLGTAIYH